MTRQNPQLLALVPSSAPLLKPCPWCNSDMASFAGMTPKAFARGSHGTFSVSCDCDAMGPPAKTMEKAIERWNHRVGEKRFCAVSVREEN